MAELKTKRFLAYTSINQIGFLILGLAAGAFDSYNASALYLAMYAITSLGFLLVFLGFRREDGRTFDYL